MLVFGQVADVLGLPAKERTAQSPVALKHGSGTAFRSPPLIAWRVFWRPEMRSSNTASSPRRPTNAGRPPIGSRRTRARVARVWAVALDVWKTEEATRAFLFRAHPMIEDRRPIDVVIQSEFGAELVVEILGRLKYGTAA
jgi:uncharacterized protein (DUF2384 family)